MVKSTIPNTPLGELPISKGHWLLGNIPNMGKDILQHFYRAEQELGTTFENPVPTVRLIATSEPDFMRHVLQINHRNYKKGRAYSVLKLILGNGLVTSNGSFWQRQRRLAQPAFYKKNLNDLFEVMAEVTANYLQTLESKRNTEIDIAKEMMAVTAQVALKALFSDTTTDNLEKVYNSMTIAQRYVSDRLNNPISPIWLYLNGKHLAFKKNMKVLDKVVLDSISKRRNSNTKQPDLLQMMMDATYEDTNEQMNDRLLKDEMLTIFSAGHETSANGLSWTLYLLTQHPEIVKKMRAEIQRVVGDRLPNFQELRQLTYIQQVIEEGMRLYPPVWGISRTAMGDDEFRGVQIKKNHIVFCLIYNAHHREDLYPQAKFFNPDRFAANKKKLIPKMGYLPFGGGPRLCIGNMFAMMEMQLILTGLLQRFDFELMEGQQIEMEALITLRPRYGIKMKIV